MGTAVEVGGTANGGTSGSNNGSGTEVLLFAVPGNFCRSLAELPAPEAFRPAVTIVSVACGGGLAAFVTSERRLYLMDLREPPAPCGSPRIVEALRGERVQCVACGTSHVIIITTTGTAFALCSPSDSDVSTRAVEVGKASLSRGTVLATMGRLSPLQLRIRASSYAVSAVSCGTGHTLLVGEGGTLFSFGEGRCGQLGLGDDVEQTSVPTNVQGLKHLRVVDVAAGHLHSCAITSFGNLFVWGDNQYGQLGDGSLKLKTTPLLVSSLESVRAVAACSATAALCANGSAFAWGFHGHRVPAQAFDEPLSRIALSRQILCGVSLAGNLLLRALGDAGGIGRAHNSSHDVALAEHGIATIAAAAGHIVALKGQRPAPLAAPSPALLPAPASLDRRPLPGALPATQLADTLLQKAASDDSARREAQELEAANERLAMALDEVKAENFFATAQLRSTVEAADARAAQAGATLAQRQGQASQLADVAQVLRLQEELAVLRSELRQADEEREAAQSGVLTGGLLEPEGTNDAVTRDLRDKHQQLALEHGRLCDEREVLQARILTIRNELAESGQRLRRVEDACVRTRVMVERQRLQVVSMQQHTSRLEEETVRTEEQLLPTALHERARLDAAATRFAEEREGLEIENAQLRLEQQQLSARLLELKRDAATQIRNHQDMLSEVRTLTLEHTSSEQLLAQKQAVCARLEGEICGLRSENAHVQQEAIDLQRHSMDAERNAHILADEALKQCNSLRAQLGSGNDSEKQVFAREEVVVELRSRLAAAKAEEVLLGEEITQRATEFAEEMSEQQEMVWKLHAALSDMRTASSKPAPAASPRPHTSDAHGHDLEHASFLGAKESRFDSTGAGSTRAMVEQPSIVPPLQMAQLSLRAQVSQAQPGSEPSRSMGPEGSEQDYGRRHMWSQSTQPATSPAYPVLGGLTTAGQSMHSGTLGGHSLVAGSGEGVARMAALGLVEGEAQHMSNILRETAQRREELLARMARA